MLQQTSHCVVIFPYQSRASHTTLAGHPTSHHTTRTQRSLAGGDVTEWRSFRFLQVFASLPLFLFKVSAMEQNDLDPFVITFGLKSFQISSGRDVLGALQCTGHDPHQLMRLVQYRPDILAAASLSITPWEAVPMSTNDSPCPPLPDPPLFEAYKSRVLPFFGITSILDVLSTQTDFVIIPSCQDPQVRQFLFLHLVDFTFVFIPKLNFILLLLFK